jgi:hypothetical protein
MKKTNLFLLSALFGSLVFASAQDSIEFEGPDEAPIYVLEGDFKQSFTSPVLGEIWNYTTEFQGTMDVNSGAMLLVGQAKTEGMSNGSLLNMDFSMAMKGVAKQAGAALRWSAKAAMSGQFSARSGGLITESGIISGTYQFRNMILDEITGEQTGIVSYSAVIRNNFGSRFPFIQPPTQTTLPRPTIYASEGEWREVAGDWSSNITADVFPNGRIAGTGLLVVGDSEDPYANVAQNIKGKLNPKTGVATLNGAGATKSTSKVRITLNYVDSEGETLPGKSSVSAYAQKRRF